MEFKRHFGIKKIEDKDIDVDGEDETQKIRTVTLEKGELKITLKGERDTIEGFRTGDNVEVKITNSQTELFTPDGYKITEGDKHIMTELCPVCGGRGTVAPGFYDGVNNPDTTDTQRVTCRACGGRGII